MKKIEEKLKEKLKKRELEGNLRVLGTKRATTDFFSNDYLGLARNPALLHLIHDRFASFNPQPIGATGSRLLSGNNDFYEKLEEKLASVFSSHKALIFNSGYTANLSLFSSIPQKGDTIIYDEYIHACIKEGARLSFADRFSFKHNDLKDLKAKLEKGKGEKFIVAESVYSMDGDFSPIREMVQLATEYNAHIILDEAHSTGVWGKKGSGLAVEMGIEKEIFARVYTFGKGMGAHGACVCGSENLVNYLINFARPFIYTTALPLHSLISIEQAFDYISENIDLQKQIVDRITFFNQKINEYKIYGFIQSSSPIQALVVGGNEKTKQLSKLLIQKGFDVRPILSPTVKTGEERLRICLHIFNSNEEIESLIQTIKSFQS